MRAAMMIIAFVSRIAFAAAFSGCATRPDLGRAADWVSTITNVISATGGIASPSDGETDTDAITADPAVRYAGPVKVDNRPVDKEVETLELYAKMNIRRYANPGELKGVVPIAGQWYSIATGVIPAGSYSYGNEGGVFVIRAKDFTSSSGQAYRMEGFWADGTGGTLTRSRVLRLPADRQSGAIFICWATVEGP